VITILFPRIFYVLSLISLLSLFNLTLIQTALAASTDIFAAADFESSAIQDDIIRCILPLCTGTDEDDIIIGSFLDETIFGLKGGDKIQGNNGNDVVFGDDGNDIIQGGGGFDRLFGEDGNDVLVSDAEISLVGLVIPQLFDEVAINNRFNDLLLGIGASAPSSSSQLTINVINSSDIFASQIPDDILAIKGTLLDGGKGDDNLIGQSGNENFIGGPGHDYFNCNEGIDTILDYNPKEDTADMNCENLE
jgi:Ca2+-binding RTX toxin-like protein